MRPVPVFHILLDGVALTSTYDGFFQQTSLHVSSKISQANYLCIWSYSSCYTLSSCLMRTAHTYTAGKSKPILVCTILLAAWRSVCTGLGPRRQFWEPTPTPPKGRKGFRRSTTKCHALVFEWLGWHNRKNQRCMHEGNLQSISLEFGCSLLPVLKLQIADAPAASTQRDIFCGLLRRQDLSIHLSARSNHHSHICLVDPVANIKRYRILATDRPHSIQVQTLICKVLVLIALLLGLMFTTDKPGLMATMLWRDMNHNYLRRSNYWFPACVYRCISAAEVPSIAISES